MPASPLQCPSPALTAAEVAKHSTPEDLWVIIDGSAYDLTSWVHKHPGGQLPLINLAGKDASEAFEAFHRGNVRPMLKAFFVGDVRDLPRDPVLEDFRAVREKLRARGLFKPTPRFYLAEGGADKRAADSSDVSSSRRPEHARALIQAALCACLFAAVVALASSPHRALRLLSGAVLGIFWQQVAFVGHDAGHNGVTGRRLPDSLLGVVLGNALTGIGIGWWKSTHNVHHCVVNSVDHDPDIQHMPFMAISPEFVRGEGVFSRFHMDRLQCTPFARAAISLQAALFFPLLLVARYGLVLQGVKVVGWEWHKRHTGFGSPRGALNWTRALEAAGFGVYFGYMGLLLGALPAWAERVLFVLVSHAAFSIMHLQINLSHWSRHTYLGRPEGSWVETQLSGTLDWSCPRVLDWFHGGLQFQIEHHLFPRMPRANLREASGEVRALCARHGLEYRVVGFAEATREILGTLRATALVAREEKAKEKQR